MREIEFRTHANGLCENSVKLGGKDVPTGKIVTIRVKIGKNSVDAHQNPPDVPRGIIFNGLLATLVFADGSVWLIHRPNEDTKVFERTLVVRQELAIGRPRTLLYASPNEFVPMSRITTEDIREESGIGHLIRIDRGQTA